MTITARNGCTLYMHASAIPALDSSFTNCTHEAPLDGGRSTAFNSVIADQHEVSCFDNLIWWML